MTTTCRGKLTIALCTFCVLLSPLLIEGQPGTNHGEIIPRIQLDNVPLSDCIKNLARQADFNFILDPRVPSDTDAPTVTFVLTNTTASEALDRVLKLRGLVKIENPVTSITRIAPAKLGVKPVSLEQAGNDTNAAVPLITFDSVPFKDAVQALANHLHVEITFDQKLMAPPAVNWMSSLYVTVRWKKLTPKQALVALLDNYDLVLISDPSGSSARITTREEVPKSKSP